MSNTLFCKNRDEWRNWLQENHLSEKEIWLIYNKKHTKKPSVRYNEAVEEALCFGWIDSTIKRIDEQRYKQKFTPRNNKSNWSLLNKKRVEKMIQENKMTAYGLEKVAVAKKNGKWEKAYASLDVIEIPGELKKALQANKKAWNNFKNFAPSYQKIYSSWVGSAKRKETIDNRVSVVVERAANNLKPGMM